MHLRPLSLVLGLALAAGALLSVGSIPSGASTSLPPMGWSQAASLPSSFATRWDMAAAYFPTDGSVVLFGGSPQVQGDPWRNDTWIYTGGSWSKGPVAPSGLTPRGGAAMAYDPAIDKIVLFGGQGSAWPPNADTWLFDGSTWTQGPAAPAGMGGRAGAGMAYDPDTGKIVLLGGSGTQPYNDTWLFDGSTWTKGPAAPAGMQNRAFFGMTYDATLHDVVAVGGDGTTDTWLFNGSSWIAGPALPSDVGLRERVRIVYDPDLSATILFGGMYPYAQNDMWMLQGGVWTKVATAGSPNWPGDRLDSGLVWNSDFDALMVVGGETGDGDLGALRDAWFFRDVPAQVSSVTLSPNAPNAGQTITVSTGSVSGGYGTIRYEYDWYQNGTLVSGLTGTRWKNPGDKIGDAVRVSVRLHDSGGIYGPWISSTVIVGGGSVSGDATVTMDDGPPGATVNVEGTGFGPGEEVDVHLGSTTGTQVGSATADAQGSFSGASATLPDQLRGGQHDVYGVGQDSGTIALGEMNVTPSATLDPSRLAAGQTLGYDGVGFAPSESVTISFADGTTFHRTADSSGNINANLTMPAEPGPTTTVVGSASNGTTSDSMAVVPSLSAPYSAGDSGPATVELTGLRAADTVRITFDSSPGTQTFTTDATGSLTADVTVPSSLGWHVMRVHAVNSSVDMSQKIQVMPGVSMSPSTGKSGTMVTITSGPGWIPGEKLSLYWRGAVLEQTLIADGTGSVTTTFKIPSHKAGKVSVEITDAVLGQSSSTNFTVKG